MAKSILAKRRVETLELKHFDIRKPSDLTFKEFADLYFERHAKPRKKSWPSVVAYLNHLKGFMGDEKLAQINLGMAEDYAAKRKEMPIEAIKHGPVRYPTNSLINRELGCLKAMLNKAVDWGDLLHNPVIRMRKLKEGAGRTRFLSEKELTRLLEVSSVELQEIITVFVNTGMRKAELQNLKWSDLNFDRGLITLLVTKNGKARHIPMTETVKTVLLKRRIRSQGNVWVFPGESGMPYDFSQAFETARKRAGFPEVRIHDLRHTFASHMVMKGANLVALKDILGHSDLKMVARYAHLSDQHKAEAVARLNGLPSSLVTISSQSAGVTADHDFEKIVSTLSV